MLNSNIFGKPVQIPCIGTAPGDKSSSQRLVNSLEIIFFKNVYGLRIGSPEIVPTINGQ